VRVGRLVGLFLLVPSERLAGTAWDARIRGRAGAESREGIDMQFQDIRTMLGAP
jgi:hypothetical protein